MFMRKFFLATVGRVVTHVRAGCIETNSRVQMKNILKICSLDMPRIARGYSTTTSSSHDIAGSESKHA